MDENDSRKLLQQVHDEINNLPKLDKEGSALLKDIDNDIRQLLERSGEEPLDVHPTVIERMERGVRHFEVDHPELTTLITKLIDSLSTAGV